MKKVIIQKNQAGGRMDKFLFKYLSQAGSGFIYRMLRKKNITLNGKKADGKEKLCQGDEICFFFSDETFEKFSGTAEAEKKDIEEYPYIPLAIVYEDENVLFLNKPAGMLSQKAEKKDFSINEYAIGYLLSSGRISREELHTFKPSVCNRLDRNTSGLITVGASMEGTRELAYGFKERTFDKYYLCIVSGKTAGHKRISGSLVKDEKTNKVTVHAGAVGDSYIETEYETLFSNGEISVLKVKLITGKTHQIRAHLAFLGHPILGDPKYGDARVNEYYRKKFGVKYQLLHSWQLHIPDSQQGCLSGLAGKVFQAQVPEVYGRITGIQF